MNEKDSFIIEDLDDFHVVIKADEEWRVRRDLEAEVSALSIWPFHRSRHFSLKRIRIAWSDPWVS